jgi:hypothetical protein
MISGRVIQRNAVRSLLVILCCCVSLFGMQAVQRPRPGPPEPRPGRRVFDVRDYGAHPDGHIVDDGVVVAGSTALTSASAAFTAGDIGKPVDVLGAGPSINGRNDQLRTTIAAVQDTHTAILATPAQVNISNAHVSWGTDQRPPIQAVIDAAATGGGGTAYIPAGCYRISALLTITASDIRITGDGETSEIYMSHVYTFAEGGATNQGDGLPNLYIGSGEKAVSPGDAPRRPATGRLGLECNIKNAKHDTR